MIEEVPLPVNTGFFGDDFFPLGNDPSHIVVWRKGNQRMDVVGHQDEQVPPPVAASHAKLDRFEYCPGNIGDTELV